MIYFTRQEQRIIILLGIVMLLSTGILLLKWLQPGWIMQLSMGKPDFDVETDRKSPRFNFTPEKQSEKKPEEKKPVDQQKTPRVETASKKTDPSAKININTASKEELKSLPGIGDVRAQSIIDYRNKHGKFSDINQLLDVYNIGDKTLQRIKDTITVGDQ